MNFKANNSKQNLVYVDEVEYTQRFPHRVQGTTNKQSKRCVAL